MEYTINTFIERDRIGIWVNDIDDKTIFEIWDNETRDLIEDGFIDFGNLEISILDYLKSIGIIN